jgi:hypothetical protein
MEAALAIQMACTHAAKCRTWPGSEVDMEPNDGRSLDRGVRTRVPSRHEHY